MTGGGLFGRASGHLCLAAALLSLAPGCAARMGQKAAQGAIAELRDQNANRTGPPPAQVAAQNATNGVISALDDPAQQARLRQLVSEAVAAATKTAVDQMTAEQDRIQSLVSEAVAAATTTAVDQMTAELVAQLGADGNGPLAVSLSQAGQRVSTSVAGGMVGGVVSGMGAQLAALAPECAGPNRAACLEQRLQQTTRTTAANFSKGVRDSIGWQLLLVAFALGIAGGLLASWLVSLRHERRTFRTV